MDCSADLAKACNSVCENLAGDNSASLVAERALQVKLQSEDLESMLLNYTQLSRLPAYENCGGDDYEHFLDVWTTQTLSTPATVRYYMSAEDITYKKNGKYVLTPNIEDVRTLTNYILTQMNLDSVGMGACLTLTSNRESFKDSTLFKEYLNNGQLCVKTEERYDKIVETIHRFER